MSISPAAIAARHAGFLDRLEGSEPYVLLAAHVLRASGYQVLLAPLKRARTFADRHANRDPGDLWFRSGSADRWGLLEVKSSTRSFTGNEWPFGSYAIVDSEDSYAAKPHDRLVAYMDFSKDAGWFYVADARHRSRWFTRSISTKVKDPETGEDRFMPMLYRVSPLELVTFHPVGETLDLTAP
jgi:hypothetical protein